MTKIIENIPFELHLTTNDLLNEEIPRFKNLCKKISGKPLIIELSRGKISKQPMFNKVIKCESPEQALKNAGDYVKEFIKANFPVKRLKIEIPIEFSTCVNPLEHNLSQTYFEWHGKIKPEEIKQLSTLCLKHKVHLSRNSIKKEDSTKFLTLREYGTKETFQNRIENLIKDLEENTGTIYKNESEYCVYDNNIFLDEGWLAE